MSDASHQHSGKPLLLLAYMFPPIVDAGGFRPLAFARYLPEFGYDPIVLSRPDTAGLPLDVRQLDTLSRRVRIERVSVGFRDGWQQYMRRRVAWLAPIEKALGRPRGWLGDALAWRVARRDELRPWEVSWMNPAIETGLELIARYKPAAILATAPPFETFKAGWALHKRTGVPLIADFRDPWTYGVLWKPPNARRARSEANWEQRVVEAAARVVVVTPSMQRAMIAKYPALTGKVELVLNGYEDLPGGTASPPEDRFVLSYVGSIMERRFPPVLFEALRRLRAQHGEVTRSLVVQFVGPNQCGFPLPERIESEGVSDMVRYLGPMGHDRCRELMRESHVLLHIETVAQYAVSSKLFEYFSARRAILGIVPKQSDDETFLHSSGAGTNAGVSDPDTIASAIYTLWQDWRSGKAAATVDESWLRQFHRREQTRKLAALLDGVFTSPTN